MPPLTDYKDAFTEAIQDFSCPHMIFALTKGDHITRDWLHRFRRDRLEDDDIFQPRYLEHLLFCGATRDEVEIDPDVEEVLDSWEFVSSRFVPVAFPSGNVAEGPHLVYTGELYQSWRIYPDKGETLIRSFRPVNLVDRKYNSRCPKNASTC